MILAHDRVLLCTLPVHCQFIAAHRSGIGQLACVLDMLYDVLVQCGKGELLARRDVLDCVSELIC